MIRIIECVPNFSEGRDLKKIREITDCIESVPGVFLLNIDPGKDTHRTVVTFAGDPDSVIEAAFQSIKKAGEILDMRFHQGVHPRMGSTDVCPLVPIRGITLEETAIYSKKLGERLGRELGLPIYLYEAAQLNKKRSSLSQIRAGEYEGLKEKIYSPEWIPDYGPAHFDEKRGATVIGARDFLIAYNINLNTSSITLAHMLASQIRESGRILREGDKSSGIPILDSYGKPVRIPGSLKAVKAIGWYIEEYGIAQVSMNLTNIRVSPLHRVFEEVNKEANLLGVQVIGSELIGLIPLVSLIDTAHYYLRKENRSLDLSEMEKIQFAIQVLGLNALQEFRPKERIIEYIIAEKLGFPN